MKAIEISAPGQVQIVEREQPRPGMGELLLRIGYVGFCGSDLNTFRGLNPLVKLPVIPGHEIGATIEEAGAGVPAHLVPGLHVTVNPYTSCGHCRACRNGRPNACELNETLGVQRNGAMASYMVLPWEKVLPGGDLPVCDLALVEPMSVGFHAVNRGGVARDEVVMVTGCGMIGLGAIVGAVARGARVVAVDVDDSKLALARKLGAWHTLNSASTSLADGMREITDGMGADVTIEAVGRGETYLACVAETSFTGRMVCIGYAKERVPFETQYFVKKELDIRGSRNATPPDFEAVMDYLTAHPHAASSFVSAVYPPEEAQQALEFWNQNPGQIFRILINFDKQLL